MSGQSAAPVARTGNSRFLKTVAAISTVAGWFSAAMIVVAVGITCQMIFVRFVLNGSTVWQTEAVIYLMIAATLIGLPYVQRLRGHVNVDLLPIALAPRLRFGLALLMLGASIVIVSVMLWYAYEWWHFAWERSWRSDTVWGVLLWKPYAALPIGLALFLLQLVADFYAVATGIEHPFGLAPEDGFESRVEGEI